MNVIEIERTNKGGWQVVRPVAATPAGITAQTPMAMGGPIAGSPMLRTAADPTGKAVLGTVNNCAMGFTPWGTYLACEENFNGYFRNTAPFSALETRYGVTSGTPVSLWYTTDPRWDADVEPNEPNRFGWVVELDPFDPDSTPVKRTALGRLKHEGAWVQETKDGRVVVYMGDDQHQRVHLPLRLQPALEEGPQAGHRPARRRRALRGQVQRGRHRLPGSR